jgi:lysylphosphatidylglycerol synthetase-like protein (DUF2156 family)
MNELLERFGIYFNNFAESIHPIDFVVNLFIATVLSMALASFYIHFGNTVSNRRKFSSNFVPLALTTMLVMIIVKSSLALSLGLVGALSIVRFRAAIKDPEELTYLFLVIGLGLCTGANQPFLAVILMSFLFIILYLHKKVKGEKYNYVEDGMYINITTDAKDLDKISDILNNYLDDLDLKRIDFSNQNSTVDMSYTSRGLNSKELFKMKNELTSLSDLMKITIIEKPNLI